VGRFEQVRHRPPAPLAKPRELVVACAPMRSNVNLSTNERTGLGPDELELMDDCVEIPVWGLPYSYNVATATAMALYEYCRQFPT
jgi:tRNA C32,U32 (ribose-2'-O)-methylase TrmJ